MHSNAATLAIKDFISRPTSIERRNLDHSEGGGLKEGKTISHKEEVDKGKELNNQYKEQVQVEFEKRSSLLRIRGICDLILQDHLTSHQEGLGQLYKGMSAVLPTELFAMFTASELQVHRKEHGSINRCPYIRNFTVYILLTPVISRHDEMNPPHLIPFFILETDYVNTYHLCIYVLTYISNSCISVCK